MKVYFGFDDTDNRDSLYGTGKLVRWFLKKIPEDCRCLGVARQQLLVCDGIPYTSHNSSACLIMEIPDPTVLNHIIEEAVSHIETYAAVGSDPGLCVATERDAALDDIIEFGRHCTRTITTQKQALESARRLHLSGHGGTNDGIIGAAAAVGLTLYGWSGRFIEWGNLRDWPRQTTVAELKSTGIDVLSIDRNAMMPARDDIVITNDWLRPRLIGHRPVLLVKPQGQSEWANIDSKRSKNNHSNVQKENLAVAAKGANDHL
jgi:hypothetical protein